MAKILEKTPFSGVEIYDLDTLLFRACFAAEHRYYWLVYTDRPPVRCDYKKEADTYRKDGPECEIWVEHVVEPVENCIQNLKTTIEGCHRVLGGFDQHFFLSGKDNFRYKVSSVRPYKGNRDPKHRPVHEVAVREWAIRHLMAEVVDGMEADDGVGIKASASKEACIVSNDKDLRQIPGWHYNFVTKELTYVGRRHAGLYFFQQLLTGDLTDNVPGIEGLGEVGASKILDGCSGVREAETRVLQAYQERYGLREGWDRFLETGRLVKIRQDEKETLWEPRFVSYQEGETSQVSVGSASPGPIGQGGS